MYFGDGEGGDGTTRVETGAVCSSLPRNTA